MKTVVFRQLPFRRPPHRRAKQKINPARELRQSRQWYTSKLAISAILVFSYCTLFLFLIFSWQMRASASNDVFFSTDQTFMRRETGRVVFKKAVSNIARSKDERLHSTWRMSKCSWKKKNHAKLFILVTNCFHSIFFLHEFSFLLSASCQKYTKVYKQPVGAHLHLRSLESSKVPDRWHSAQ